MKAKSSGRTIEIRAHSFTDHHRNQFWYVGITLMVIAAFAGAIYLRDYLGAVVALVVGIAIFRVSGLKPEERTVRVGADGVHWGKHFFPYHQLRSFWFDNRADSVTFYLERVIRRFPISFAVNQEQAEHIAQELSQYLPWHNHRGEPFSDRVSRFLKL